MKERVLGHLLRLEGVGVGVAIATEEWMGFFRRADTTKLPPQPQVTSWRSTGGEGEREGGI